LISGIRVGGAAVITSDLDTVGHSKKLNRASMLTMVILRHRSG
jgi:hypothetical protein